jgi:hypothetical protein
MNVVKKIGISVLFFFFSFAAILSKDLLSVREIAFTMINWLWCFKTRMAFEKFLRSIVEDKDGVFGNLNFDVLLYFALIFTCLQISSQTDGRTVRWIDVIQFIILQFFLRHFKFQLLNLNVAELTKFFENSLKMIDKILKFHICN